MGVASVLLLAAATAASSSGWPPATGDYGAYEDISCRAKSRPVKYPGKLERRGIGGRVMLRVTVDADSRFVTAVVYESSGHPELDAAGLEVLPRWCFRAGRKDGNLVAGDVLVPIQFNPR